MRLFLSIFLAGICCITLTSMTACNRKKQPSHEQTPSNPDESETEGPTKQFDSPNAVFAAAKAAVEEANARAFLDCLTKESVLELAGLQLIDGSRHIRFADNIRAKADVDPTAINQMKPLLAKEKPLKEILDRHGLQKYYTMPADEWKALEPGDLQSKKGGEQIRELAKHVKRPYAFVTDISKVEGFRHFAFNFNGAKLGEVTINGQRAKAVIKGVALDDSASFHFTDGSWRFGLFDRD